MNASEYVVPAPLLLALLNYLKKKPFEEVAPFMNALSNVKPVEAVAPPETADDDVVVTTTRRKMGQRWRHENVEAPPPSDSAEAPADAAPSADAAPAE